MALLYVYFFALYEEEKGIYADSEQHARHKFKEYFNKEAGPLLRRERW